jgi:hypothetical protein
MSSAQAATSFAADAPRYGVNTADAYYALNQAGTGSTTVTQIVAGSNVTITPTTGTGAVTINAGTAAPGVTALNGETGNVQIQSADNSIAITTPGTGVVDLQVNSVLSVGSGTLFGPAGTNTPTIWKVGNLLFCAVAISPNNPANPGYAYFSLPNGLKWANSTAGAIWPQVICSVVSPNPPAVVSTDTYICAAQVSQPTSPVNNNNIVIQCTTAAGLPQLTCMVNCLAFGPVG